MSFPDGVERSDASLTNGAGVRVTAGDGGSIAVNARNLEMTGESELRAGIAGGLGDTGSQAGNIEINAIGAINLNNESRIANLVEQQARGQGGDISISASTLRLEGGAQMGTGTVSTGKGGNLTVVAQNVQVIGSTPDGELPSGLYSQTLQNLRAGDAGNLTIHTNKLLVQDGAQVGTGTFGSGKGGNLTVVAQDVQLLGESTDDGAGSVLAASAQPNSTGNAGDLTINTNTLLVRDGAVVSTNTSGSGKGGNLTVVAQDVQVIGESTVGRVSGLAASTQPNSIGNAGDLTINTNTLLVQDGAEVLTTTSGSGKGGNLTVVAQDVQLIGTSADGESPAGLGTSATPNSTGNAGDLNITTSQLQVLDGANVNASTSGAGKGGNLTVNTDTLQLKNDGRITAQSRGTGAAGDININVKNNVNASNGQVLTQAEQSSGGNINITAGKNIFLRNNSDIRTTLLTTAGSGGNIRLEADSIVALEDSDILAFAPEGTGGNITFDTRAFLSDPLFPPRSQTYDRATLNSLDGNNRVDVNASGSISTGTISGTVDSSFLQNSLLELAQNPIDTEALVANSCVVRSNKRNGTFLITGKGGLPYRPGDAVASVYAAVDVKSVANNTSETKSARRWKIGDPIVEPTGVYRLENGQRILSRECGK